MLPAHLVRDDGAVSGSGQRLETATVVAVVIDTLTLELDEADRALALDAIVDIAERLATHHDVDRVRVAADRSLFVSGSATPDDGVEAGLAFASALSREFHALSERTSVAFTTNIGVSTGAIATGVLAGTVKLADPSASTGTVPRILFTSQLLSTPTEVWPPQPL